MGCNGSHANAQTMPANSVPNELQPIKTHFSIHDQDKAKTVQMKSQYRIRNKRTTNCAAYPLIGVSLLRVLLRRQRIAWKAPVKPPNRRPVRQASSLIIRSFSDSRSCNTRSIHRLSRNIVTCLCNCPRPNMSRTSFF